MLVHAAALLDGTLQLQPPGTPAPGPSPEPLLPPAPVEPPVPVGPPLPAVPVDPPAPVAVMPPVPVPVMPPVPVPVMPPMPTPPSMRRPPMPPALPPMPGAPPVPMMPPSEVVTAPQVVEPMAPPEVGGIVPSRQVAVGLALPAWVTCTVAPAALIAISVIVGPPAGSVKLCPAAVRPVKVVPDGVVLSSSVQTLLCWVSEVTPLRVVCVGFRTLSLV